MDAGSRIVNFIRDGTVFAFNSEIYNIGAHAQWLYAWTSIDDNGAEVTNDL